MQRLQLVLLCSFLIAASPARSWGQTSACTTYVGLEGGVLGLNLPGFRPFQQVNAGQHVRFLDTDSGNGVGLLYGGRVGWTLYEPTTFNGIRVEARGFFSERDDASQQRLPAGTVFNLFDSSAAIVFLNPANTDSRHQVKMTSGEMLFKWDMAASNSLIVSPYAGLSMLDLDQHFNVTAVDAIAGQRMSITEDVQASYWGGTAGIEVLTRIFPTTILSVDAGVSLFDFSADRAAQQTNNLPPANIFLNQNTGHAAFAANLRFELSQELRWCQLVVFGSAQFLDTVPEVAYGKLLSAGTVVQPSRLDVGEAVGFTGGFSLRIPF